MSWDIVGQERAVALLRRAVEDEARLSHAYLFAGPEHVGRATTARRFAQALNCEASGERPCLECRVCRLIGEEKHADVETVAPGGVCDEPEHKDHAGSREIRICQVRRLERVVIRATFDARYRVVIVDPVEALTTEAANAFLKTLEEPPANVVLALVAAQEERIPETVRSRCRRAPFFGAARLEIERALQERWGADLASAARLSRLAQGRLGWAVTALQDEALLLERSRAMDELGGLIGAGYERRFSAAGALGLRYSHDASEVQGKLEAWEAWWRDVLLVAAGQDELATETDRLDTLRSQASQWGIEGALRGLTAVRETRRQLEENANPTLALETLLLELPGAPSGR